MSDSSQIHHFPLLEESTASLVYNRRRQLVELGGEEITFAGRRYRLSVEDLGPDETAEALDLQAIAEAFSHPLSTSPNTRLLELVTKVYEDGK